jgi:hypothetical protein
MAASVSGVMSARRMVPAPPWTTRTTGSSAGWAGTAAAKRTVERRRA